MKKKYDYIDALRGIAILLVMIVHTSRSGPLISSHNLSLILWNGARGVQLFFLVSAFTLFLSAHRNTNQERNPSLNFFIRRFFRIAPIYYLGVIYFSFLNPDTATPVNVFSSLLFLNGVNPFYINNLIYGGWSITVEIIFYFFVPFLIARITTLNKAISLLIATILFKFLIEVLWSMHSFPSQILWNDLFLYIIPNQLPVFACGIVAFFLVIKKDFEVGAWQLGVLSIILIINTVFGSILNNMVLLGVAIMLVLIMLSKKEFSLFVNPLFVFLGKISYSCYIVHFAVIIALENIGLTSIIDASGKMSTVYLFCLRLIMVVCVTSLIAYLFYRVVEVPMQSVGKKLIHTLEKRALKRKFYSHNFNFE